MKNKINLSILNPSVLLSLLSIFIVFNTLNAFIFALQAGVISESMWSKEVLKTVYGFKLGTVGGWEFLKVILIYIIFPIIALGFLGFIFYFCFKLLKGVYPKPFKKIFKVLVSLKLAVLVIVLLGVISAVGTFVEAEYDATMASRLVYHSWYMYAVLFTLCVQLISVMIDRWPWKIHHLAFIFAHIGIILLLYGSVLTRYFGIDGSMRFDIGQKNRHITISDMDLNVYSTFDGERYTLLHGDDVDFFKNPPSKDDPYEINLGKYKFVINDYYRYAYRESKIVESEDKRDKPAVRIQISGKRAKDLAWILQPRSRMFEKYNMGPLSVVLTDDIYPLQATENAIVLKTIDSEKLSYKIYSQSKAKVIKSGILFEGDVVKTGFMDFELKLIDYKRHAAEKITYDQKRYPSELTRSAIRVEFGDEIRWVGDNSLLKFYTDSEMLVLNFGNKRLNLGFDIFLQEFRVGKYQGTNRAMAYESDVLVKGDKYNISMNEPFKFSGYTFYQSSFDQDEMGKPIASILSVNRDPGRFLKYLGSIFIVLGSILLFYFKKMLSRKKKV